MRDPTVFMSTVTFGRKLGFVSMRTLVGAYPEICFARSAIASRNLRNRANHFQY
jgi:hypothetical protein